MPRLPAFGGTRDPGGDDNNFEYTYYDNDNIFGSHLDSRFRGNDKKKNMENQNMNQEKISKPKKKKISFGIGLFLINFIIILILFTFSYINLSNYYEADIFSESNTKKCLESEKNFQKIDLNAVADNTCLGKPNQWEIIKYTTLYIYTFLFFEGICFVFYFIVSLIVYRSWKRSKKYLLSSLLLIIIGLLVSLLFY